MKNPKTKQSVVRLARFLTDLPVLPFGVLLMLIGLSWAWIIKIKPQNIKSRKPRLLWASTPIKSLVYMAHALRQAGYISETAVVEMSPIYAKSDFDYVLMTRSRYGRIIDWICTNFRAYLFFARALSYYDIFHFYFDGGILKRTLLARFEPTILKMANKRLVVMPYGSDAFVYDLIADPIWRHALLTHYPMYGDTAARVQKRLRHFTAHADVVIACLVHFVNLPRWDLLPLTCYPVDTNLLQPVLPSIEGVIRIAHAPNHRGVKGTEYLEYAIKRLREDGYNIVFDIIEGVPNSEAIKRISQADIFVDQLIFGFALAALEGLALGKIVISALENTSAYDLFRQYSYLDECPIVSATTSTIYNVLKQLIDKRHTWQQLGLASRVYVEKRHSYVASAKMFEAIYQKIWWRNEKVDLINFYHPLLEQKQLTNSENI